MRDSGEFQEILDTGYNYFDNAQYNDALEYFSRAMKLEHQNDEAEWAYNQVIQLVVPRYHFNMLNDKERNEVYDYAIRNAVDEKTTVLDVGTGSGLLSMMAARADAKMIYACEMVRPVAEIARTIVSSNGYSDRIKIISKKSSDIQIGVDIPGRLDLLITETIDSALIGEGIIPIIKHAREKLLKDDAEIIPRGAKVFAALLESQAIYGLNNADTAVGLDVSFFNNLSTKGAYPVRLNLFNHRFLSDPFEVCEFDFKADSLEPRKFQIPVQPTRNGICHAVAFWFDLYLNAETTFSSSPLNSGTHWKQAVQCFPAPISIGIGQNLDLSVNQDLTRFQFDLA